MIFTGAMRFRSAYVAMYVVILNRWKHLDFVIPSPPPPPKKKNQVKNKSHRYNYLSVSDVGFYGVMFYVHKELPPCTL